MSKVKNISGGPLEVPLLGRLVEDGETVEVPDFQPGAGPGEVPEGQELAIAWPSNRWEPVSDAVKPEKAAKVTAGKADG